MNNINIFGYGSIPRKFDRGRVYLYFKKWISRLFRFSGARNMDNLIRVLLLASVNNGYVEGSSKFLGLCGQTVRNHLRYQDPSRFLHVNRMLISRMRRLGAFSKPLTLAIDWHDEMYYGDPKAEGFVGTRSKKGSHHAYRFASASVVVDGERLTIAVTPMVNEPTVKHVKRLLTDVFKLGIKVKTILFDRGYYSVELIRYLNSLDVGYVIHLPSRIRGLKDGEDRMYTTGSHMKRVGVQATFRLVTVKAKDKGGEDKLFIFATNTGLKPMEIRRLYRGRWGVETSYRMIRRFHMKTTSKQYMIRILYFYLTVILYNLWIMINYRCESYVSAYMLKLYMTIFLILIHFQLLKYIA